MMNFIDFKKAFNCVHQSSIQLISKKCGISTDVVMTTKNLQEEYNAQCLKCDSSHGQVKRRIHVVRCNAWIPGMRIELC